MNDRRFPTALRRVMLAVVYVSLAAGVSWLSFFIMDPLWAAILTLFLIGLGGGAAIGCLAGRTRLGMLLGLGLSTLVLTYYVLNHLAQLGD